MPLARLLAQGRPLVFNPLVSLWDTLVQDRGRFRRNSIAARALAVADRVALRAADLVVADTEANAAFLARLADVPRSEVEVCLVGAEERVFRPGWRRSDEFACLFVGKLIPLHGLETILAAASLAPDVRFRVVGSGQLEPLLARRPPNVEWVSWVEYERLPDELHRCGCALGIFGGSDKAERVIPNKVFQAMACGAPVVTANTHGARELLVDDESALLVPPGDPEALVAAVRRLRDDRALAERIAAGGATVYRDRASEAVLGKRWRHLIEALL
jgi:glycosyltransferase involved in cell wall biosynthesis